MLRAILGTTAGKLAAAVAVLFVVGIVGGVLLRDPMHDRVRPIDEAIPTLTPTAVSPAAEETEENDSAVQGKGGEEATMDTPTSTPQPTPDGWSVETDPAGREYLSPPPDVEQEIRAAFDAVLSCIVIPDEGDEKAMEFDRPAVLARAEELSTSDVFDQRCAELMEGFGDEDHVGFVFVCDESELAPQNPVQCRDRSICTVARAKSETDSVLAFDVPESVECLARTEDEWGNMCLVRGTEGLDGSPNLMFAATVEREKGKWIVTEWSGAEY